MKLDREQDHPPEHPGHQGGHVECIKGPARGGVDDHFDLDRVKGWLPFETPWAPWLDPEDEPAGALRFLGYS